METLEEKLEAGIGRIKKAEDYKTFYDALIYFSTLMKIAETENREAHETYLKKHLDIYLTKRNALINKTNGLYKGGNK